MASDHEERRSTTLTVFLGGILAIFFLGFMILITGGFFVHVVLIVGVIGFMASIHYLLWGKLLAAHTAGEREEHELLERMREEELDKKRSR